MSKINVLIVDDHALVREMLQDRLQREGSFGRVGTASCADEAIDKVREEPFGVVVMDIDMPGTICFEAARLLKQLRTDVRLLFLSAFANDRYIEQALAVGALGYVTKNASAARIVSAIRDVAANRACFSEEVRRRMVFDERGPHLAAGTRSRASMLTPRELEVLRYVARGLAKKEMGALMHVSVKTVEKHTENLMRKVDIHDRVELARFAIREGLAEP